MTCERCIQLEARLDAARRENDEMRLQMHVDQGNFATDLAVKNRRITQLSREVAKLMDDSAKPSDVESLLAHWKKACGKTDRVDVARGGKRYKLAQAAIKRWGLERCVVAVDGLARFPYAGPRGRSHDEYPGSKRFDDVEHALADEVRFERCEALATEPVLTAEDRRLVQVVQESIQRVEKRQETFMRRAQRHLERAPRPAPMDVILLALEQCGKDPRVTKNGARIVALCPAHDDHSPSLHVDEGDDGRALIQCRSHGCSSREVMLAIGLREVDMFADRMAA